MYMELMTDLFSRAYGVYFIVLGIALLLSPDRFRHWYNDILVESRRAMFGGTIALLIGSFILATHHVLFNLRLLKL